jgi:hypothetical protein
MAAQKGLGLKYRSTPTSLAAVVASDTVDLPGGSARISVTTAGAYQVIAHSDSAPVTLQLAAGVMHETLIRRVYATGSVATVGIVAHYS